MIIFSIIPKSWFKKDPKRYIKKVEEEKVKDMKTQVPIP